MEGGSGWVARSGGCGGVVMVGIEVGDGGLCAGCLGWGGEFRDGGVRDWRRTGTELALSPIRY